MNPSRRTFVIGDIHGADLAVRQCLERSEFDYASDRLICLGDVCDGWPFVRECFDELLKIHHLDYIIGNHDLWTLQWAKTGETPDIWTSQGGASTLSSYKDGMPASHLRCLQNAHWYLEDNERLFVHGGMDPRFPMNQQSRDVLVWDRDLIVLAHRFAITHPHFRFSHFREIFIGHTTTQLFHIEEPARFCNVWAMDTGAGWSGRLSMMDVETKKFWQSDRVTDLYPHIRGRG